MRGILQDVRFGIRVLVKHPGFSMVAVLVLAVAIGGTTAMFSITNALVLRPIEARHPEALVRLYSHENKPHGGYRGFSYPNYIDIQAKNGVFTDLMAFEEVMVGVNEGELTRRTFAEMVSANYFETFGTPLAAGRPFLQEEERPGSAIPVVIVSHSYWVRSGSDPDLVGKTVRINARAFRVVGIARQNFTGSTVLLAPEFFLPLGMYELVANDFTNERKQTLADRKHHCLRLIGRLKPGLTIAMAQPRLQALAKGLAEAYPDANKDYTIELRKPTRISMNTYPQNETGPRTMAILLMSMSGVVLLIACLNLANMFLARAASRRREIAVRLAMGGSRARLVRQMLTEGLLLALAGGALGLVLSIWANQLLVTSLSSKVPFFTVVFDSRPDWRILLATFGFCLVSVLMFGLGPAWRLSHLNPTQELKEQVGEQLQGKGRGGRFAPRNLLVVGQLALSLALLTAACLFARGAMAGLRANPGFSFGRILLVETDASLAGYSEARGRQVYLDILERLRALPGAQSASVGYVIPFGIFSDGGELKRAGGGPRREGTGPEEQRLYASMNIVAADYFKTLGIPLLLGRDFERLEVTSPGTHRVAIIDEPLARELFKNEPALGRHIQFTDREEALEIVGVVGPIKDDVMAIRSQPHVYLPLGQQYRSGINLFIRGKAPGREAETAMLSTIRKTLRAAAPDLAVISVRSYRQFHEEGLVLWFMKTAARLFAVFGGLALFLAVIGIYGVESYIVTRRTREIGIRMALGASARNVLWMVLRQGLALTAFGLSIGFVLALVVQVLLRSMVYGIGSLDPVAFTVAPLCLAGTAILACYLPARRATRVPPMSALRYE